MAAIKENHLVTKRNVLNEIRSNSMTLQELRFFSIYLSKINPNDTSTRRVRFPIDNFRAIMELGRINIEYMKSVTNSLLSKVVNVPNERGGYTGFQLFKECVVDRDEKWEWYIEIDAHDKALPLLFEFKDRYFSYQLWNALRLKSPNQLRMYEILKQHEKIGMRILSVEELRNLLGIGKKEYERFNNFKQWVLEPCQQSLSENTDIKFTYEPHGKRGQGGKILFLKFTINKNTEYKDQMSLAEFIEEQKEEAEPQGRYDERVMFFSDACENEFSQEEIVVLLAEMRKYLPFEMLRDKVQTYDYLMDKYREMCMRASKTKITHRFGYLKSILGKEYMP